MIAGYQIRAARGFMDWSRSDLAKAANLSPETVKNIESGRFTGHFDSLAAIKIAFEKEGVIFTDGGVSKKPTCPKCGGKQ